MFMILWQAGILSVILFFALKIGLAMAFAGISRKVASAVAVGYGFGILILARLASSYMNMLQKIVYDYGYVIFIAMSLVIFYAGIHTIREWKMHKKDKASACCVAMIAPCPCCFGAVVVAIILASPFIGASAFLIGKYAALFLSLTTIIVYLISGQIVRFLNKPYPVLLGNLMLIVGLYFLISGIIMPNINTVLTSKMGALSIPSVSMFFYALVLMLVLMIFGIYKTKRKSLLIKR